MIFTFVTIQQSVQIDTLPADDLSQMITFKVNSAIKFITDGGYPRLI